MMLVPLTVLAGIAAGLLQGGRLANLGVAPLRQAWVIVVAVLLQAALGLFSPAAATSRGLLLASHGFVLAFLWLNRVMPGIPLAFVGFALNAAVITANGAMPVSPEALAAISPDAEMHANATHRLLQDGDALALLADVIPVPLLRTVVSVGDVVLAAGVAVLAQHLTRAGGGRTRGADLLSPGAASPPPR